MGSLVCEAVAVARLHPPSSFHLPGVVFYHQTILETLLEEGFFVLILKVYLCVCVILLFVPFRVASFVSL